MFLFACQQTGKLLWRSSLNSRLCLLNILSTRLSFLKCERNISQGLLGWRNQFSTVIYLLYFFFPPLFQQWNLTWLCLFFPPFLSPLAPFPALYLSLDNVYNHYLVFLLWWQIMSGVHTEIWLRTAKVGFFYCFHLRLLAMFHEASH